MVSHESNNPICYFAETNFREERNRFGMYLQDRLHHVYILGRTGTGKSTLLETKIVHDLHQGNGLCLIDVHGDLVQKVITQIPASRKQDVVYLDAADPNGDTEIKRKIIQTLFCNRLVYHESYFSTSELEETVEMILFYERKLKLLRTTSSFLTIKDRTQCYI